MTLNNAFLKSLSYCEESGKIKALFREENDSIEFSFNFLPQIRLSQNKAVSVLLKEIVSPHSELFLSESKGTYVLSSRSVSLLKKAHDSLALSLNAKIPFIEPEIQFLLSNNWNYFDYFKIKKSKPVKVENKEEFAHYLNLPGRIPLKKAFFSRMLALPINSLPSKPGEIGEILLENSAFKSSQLIFAENQKKPVYTNAVFGEFVELDFSRPLLRKIVESNLGFESINCNCCKPGSFQDENVLPNSMVKVEFLEDGFYFDSMIPSFAGEFHENNPRKERRTARKIEFCLEEHPIGPFYAGEKAVVPLVDAKKLEGERTVRILSEKNLKWSCRKQKSFLARELSTLISIEETANKKICALEKAELKEKGLNAFNPCFDSQVKKNLNELKSACSELCNAIFSNIFLNQNHYHKNALFKAIEAFKSQLVFEFNQELQQRHFEPIYSHKGRAFIRKMENFTDLMLVSREIGLPSPRV